jgi:serine/threonine protein kinase
MSLIGQGAYGCVISPPVGFKKFIINKIYVNKKSDDVCKLFIGKDRVKNYKKEMNELEQIASYDKEHNFTVPYKGSMYGIINDYKYDNSIKKCTRPDKYGYIYQIILGNGGVDLDKAKCEISYLDFLQILKKFIEGIQKLGEKKIHQDIKPPNVLLNCNDNKLNLIDFGISINIEEAYKENSEFLTALYVFHPPDYLIVSKIFQCANNIDELLEILYHLMESLEEDADDDNIIKKLYNDNYLVYIKNKYNEIDNLKMYFYNQLVQYIATVIVILENHYIEDENDDVETKRSKLLHFLYNYVFTKELSSKIDIYPLAFIILQLRKKIKDNSINKDFINNIFTKCFDTNPFQRISTSKLIEMINEEQHTHLMYKEHPVKRQRINGGKQGFKRKFLTKKQNIILDIDSDINQNIEYNKIKLNTNKNSGVLKFLDLKFKKRNNFRASRSSITLPSRTYRRSSPKLPSRSSPKSPSRISPIPSSPKSPSRSSPKQ